ncbi:MAG: twin-arginine translocation signal domain-containing protein, partial [Caldimicrobium sp.]
MKIILRRSNMFMMKMSRRRFLQASAATALLVSTGGAHAFVAPSLSYPRKKVANIMDLKEDQ